ANGKQRPIGIATIKDRVRQQVVKTALEPAWEAHFEAASYGFRPGHSVHDAIGACFNRLNGRCAAQWVLDADIRSAFDRISHVYIDQRLGNFPARCQIQAWLKAGYLEARTLLQYDGGHTPGRTLFATGRQRGIG